VRLDLRREKTYILLVFILALILRSSYGVYLGPVVRKDGDAGGYTTTALKLLQGKGFTYGERVSSFKPPLWSFVLAGVYFVFGPNVYSARVFQALLGSIACVIIYLLGKRIFNKETASIAAAIGAIYPSFIHFGGILSAETLSILLYTLHIYYVVKVSKHSSFLNRLMSGITFGFSALCKAQILVFFPLTFIWLYLVSEGERKKKAAKLITIFIFMVFTLAPWTIRNYFVHKEFVLISTSGGVAFWTGNHLGATGGYDGFFINNPTGGSYFVEGLSEVESDRWWFGQGIKFIREYPWEFLKLSIPKFTNLWRVYTLNQGMLRAVLMVISFGGILPFFIYGFLSSLKDWRRAGILHLFIFYYSAIFTVSGSSQIRMRIPMMSFIIILTSFGIYHLWETRIKVKFGKIAGHHENRLIVGES